VQDIAKAKSLLSAAGHPHGSQHPADHRAAAGDPRFAQIVEAGRTSIGVDIKLKIESSAAYYGKATFGNSDWLDATMSLVDYGHRSVPNVFLTAPLTTDAKTGTGPWNAAHFNNSPVRQPGQAVRRGGRPEQPARDRREDRDTAARPDADHLRVLLQLPVGLGEERDRRLPDRDRPPVPQQREEELRSPLPRAVPAAQPAGTGS
jgi:hypothetical protein